MLVGVDESVMVVEERLAEPFSEELVVAPTSLVVLVVSVEAEDVVD